MVGKGKLYLKTWKEGKCLKKRIFPLVLVLICVLSLGIVTDAQAARSSYITPTLIFSGTTAECSAICVGNKTTDEVTATLTLYDNKDTALESWSASGMYRATPNGTCKVEKGQTYTLVLTWSINGVSQPQKSTTRTCQ